MEPLVFGELTLKPEVSSGMLLLRWHGKSVDRQPGKTLDPYFDQLLDQAVRDATGIEMRFEQVEHFNSSTITSLIGLIQRARARQVKLGLVYDKALKWQRLSFDALRVLGKNDGLLEIRSV